jgi:hypothetical protein
MSARYDGWYFGDEGQIDLSLQFVIGKIYEVFKTS